MIAAASSGEETRPGSGGAQTGPFLQTLAEPFAESGPERFFCGGVKRVDAAHAFSKCYMLLAAK
jgi:hypothetical protein